MGFGDQECRQGDLLEVIAAVHMGDGEVVWIHRVTVGMGGREEI